MSDWKTLPAEIRLLVLELLPQEKHALAPYAAVSREWQAFIERKNFRRLKLRSSCLHDLEHMAVGRMGLVQHIWLNVELRPYTCRCCQGKESPSWNSSNNSTTRRAVSKLFSILGAWEPSRGGLTLELSVQSPSDSEHCFKNCHFGAKDERDCVVPRRERQLWEANPRFHDPYHGWDDGQQVAFPYYSALLRLHEDVELRFQDSLPEVRAVTKFVLRRQCRRRISPRSLSLLFGKLPRLEELVYEPWRAWTSPEQEKQDKGYGSMIEAHLPKTLKKITIFEDFNQSYNAMFQGAMVHDADPDRLPDRELGRAFARRSLELEQLSISFMVDAKHFFGSCNNPQWAWDNLRSIALTSRTLMTTAYPFERAQMLLFAGISAGRMWKLHTMTLWYADREQACAFIYRQQHDDVSITWRGTWSLHMEPRVLEAWETVASQRTRLPLRVEKHVVPRGVAKSHGARIHQLDLPLGVVDPVSLWQIWMEGLTRLE